MFNVFSAAFLDNNNINKNDNVLGKTILTNANNENERTKNLPLKDRLATVRNVQNILNKKNINKTDENEEKKTLNNNFKTNTGIENTKPTIINESTFNRFKNYSSVVNEKQNEELEKKLKKRKRRKKHVILMERMKQKEREKRKQRKMEQDQNGEEQYDDEEHEEEGEDDNDDECDRQNNEQEDHFEDEDYYAENDHNNNNNNNNNNINNRSFKFNRSSKNKYDENDFNNHKKDKGDDEEYEDDDEENDDGYDEDGGGSYKYNNNNSKDDNTFNKKNYHSSGNVNNTFSHTTSSNNNHMNDNSNSQQNMKPKRKRRKKKEMEEYRARLLKEKMHQQNSLGSILNKTNSFNKNDNNSTQEEIKVKRRRGRPKASEVAAINIMNDKLKQNDIRKYYSKNSDNGFMKKNSMNEKNKEQQNEEANTNVFKIIKSSIQENSSFMKKSPNEIVELEKNYKNNIKKGVTCIPLNYQSKGGAMAIILIGTDTTYGPVKNSYGFMTFLVLDCHTNNFFIDTGIKNNVIECEKHMQLLISPGDMYMFKNQSHEMEARLLLIVCNKMNQPFDVKMHIKDPQMNNEK
ncbi:hypothetical protein PFNF135_05866 [Plasmodium falciparum NF135/5.C10]|uniref:Uncharacterized protein n=2 Tax=Plasmodium falciparum TaxID=5833 RepID=A0A024V136_PLAFA|nr:hypothetical protein PFFVO_05055 [Plasmodium falciparum Vietnam Oak-Knoll (FVO)]ETW39838.1 hypothetical protein PFNF135_05866 [Plasmodium falciparum NF135/5.C10]